MTVALITHPACRRHEVTPGHPERPERLAAVEERLLAVGLDPFLDHRTAPAATRNELERVHEVRYLDAVEARAPTGGLVVLDGGDTIMGPHTLEAARRAAGAVVMGVNLVVSGEAAAAFCLVRPPGHHAGRGQAAGFCLFNNAAVGAAHALAAHGLARVAIADFDVHHGNGTEEIFRDDPRVLYLSTFRHPYYPWSGADTESGHIVNTPLAAGADGSDFRGAVEAHWLPALDAFRPEMILVSAGFDGHVEDEMGGLALTDGDYGWVTGLLVDAARRHARGRLVSILEGGYSLPALARSVCAHIEAMEPRRDHRADL